MNQQFGTIKISDGLYIGDQFSSQDIDTILMNHITHIINLTHKQVSNKFQSHGIIYINFNFTEETIPTYNPKNTIEKDKERDREIILDSLDKNISLIIEMIEETREQGESILMHGCRSYTVGLVLYCAYLMLKYKWGLYKTIEFLESRVHKMEMSNSLIRQLRAYESRISERLLHPLTTSWELYQGISLDEITIRNTFINSFLKGDNYVRAVNVVRTNGNQGKISWKQDNGERSLNQTSSLKKGPLKGILKLSDKVNETRGASRDRRVQVEARKSLTNNRNQSQRKSIEKQDQKYKYPNKQQNKTPISKNYNESPMYKRNRQQEIQVNHLSNPLEAKMLSSKSRKENQIFSSQQGFTTLFRNTPLQPNQTTLNKSLGSFIPDRTPLNIRFDTDNSQEKEKERSNKDISKDKYKVQNKQNGKEMVKESIKDEVARKLLKKMILEKGSSIAEIQNKQNLITAAKRKQPTHPKCQSQAILQKPKRPLQSQRVSEDNRKQRQSSAKRPMINNFLKQKSSQSRPQSPIVKSTQFYIQQESQNKMDVEKVRNSFQSKTQIRGESPAANQNRISLKDASTLLNSIFPQHGFRPKWKF